MLDFLTEIGETLSLAMHPHPWPTLVEQIIDTTDQVAAKQLHKEGEILLDARNRIVIYFEYSDLVHVIYFEKV